MRREGLCVRDGKSFVNLRRRNRDILLAARIPGKQLHEVGPCTSCAGDEFFSYRRVGGETGPQLRFIWLAARAATERFAFCRAGAAAGEPPTLSLFHSL